MTSKKSTFFNKPSTIYIIYSTILLTKLRIFVKKSNINYHYF